MADPKQRAEHALVVDDIVTSLAGCGAHTTSAPEVRRLERMFHLQSNIAGTRPAGAGILDLAALLHPTPALGGVPRSAALGLLAEIEPEGRGWFGGAVGWVDSDGNGDLAVAIRGALLDGATVTGFAGAGVVDGSDPEAEAAEVALKLDSALRAFAAESA
jgi:isochorismate synthase EntC